MKNKRTGLEPRIILDDVFPITPRYFFSIFHDFIRDSALMPEDFSRWKIEKGSNRRGDPNFPFGHGQWLLRKQHYLPGVFVAEIIVTQINKNSSKILIDIPGNEVYINPIFDDNDPDPEVVIRDFDQFEKNRQKIKVLNLKENSEATLMLKKFVVYLKRTYKGSSEKLVPDFISTNPQKGKTGPNHFPEDEWVREQVINNILTKKEARKLWDGIVDEKVKIGKRKLKKENYARTFYKITQEDWNKK